MLSSVTGGRRPYLPGRLGCGDPCWSTSTWHAVCWILGPAIPMGCWLRVAKMRRGYCRLSRTRKSFVTPAL